MKTPLFIGFILSIFIVFSCKSIDQPDITNTQKDSIVIVPAKGSYMRLTEPIACGELPARRIWVYLPPNYVEDSTKYYPVCYMHDGQNVFENGGYGSWNMHNMLNARALEGKELGIVVAIDNTSKRLAEYTPFANADYAKVPLGDAYLEAIVKHIIPYVNSHYRTLPDRAHTMLCGSSLGGLISYYGAYKADSVFGSIGAISPAFWYCKNDLKPFISTVTSRYPNATKIYFICGDSESTTMVSDMQEFYEATLARGIPAVAIKYEVVTGGKHNEASWSNQIGRVYDFLFE
ncbi:MAG: alpha/beta hydrolase [Paludibacter sp.]|nr:alpha/beta hydrolase [Paludibacter sp.]